MVKLFAFCQFLLLCFATFLLAFHSRMTAAAPQGRGGAAGVFLVIEGGKYTFNYTVARAACQRLNVTMATREQMERALQKGLQTCKFGWIAEQIAVIPRVTSDERCGRGQTGVVSWSARLDTLFAVFCYNTSATEELNETNTSPPSVPSTTMIPRTQTASPIPVTHTPSSINEKTKSPEQKLPTATVTHPVKTTHPTTAASTAPPTRHGVTTKPALVRFTFSTSIHLPGLRSSTEPALTRSVIISAENSLGVGPTALISLGVIAALLMACGAVWYFRLSAVPCGSQSLQKDDTEMWKHADSEIDLHTQRGADEEEEEESERKYSSEITLCVNPSIKANSSE